ncbi:MAG: DoxX family protein [Bacteroidetes bacterium]|nr:DoxX family protein [Bacteroidota bacterium]
MLNFIISGVEIKSFFVNIGLMLLRIFAGLSISLAHGINKIPVSDGFIGATRELGFPFPAGFAWAAGISEFGCGLLLAAGLVTRPSAFFLSATMFVAAFVRHADDPFGTKEKALLYLSIFVFFLLSGSGKFGTDHLLRNKKRLH